MHYHKLLYMVRFLQYIDIEIDKNRGYEELRCTIQKCVGTHTNENFEHIENFEPMVNFMSGTRIPLPK